MAPTTFSRAITVFSRNALLHPRIPTRAITTLNAQPDHLRREHIVIVGGGITGLATALSLHRLGIGSLVLEQGESLRTGGTSLTLSKNGWRALDIIGIANHLRPHFLQIERMLIKSQDGKELRTFNIKAEDESQELRALERKVLLETLAGQLPEDAIQYSSKLARIEAIPNGDTLLELADGSKLVAKIVIGCDGIGSPIAKWMGFPEPKYAGYCAIRGLACYEDGQPFEQRVDYFYGRGVRAGFVPISTTKVYWFICFNTPSPGLEPTDSSVIKKQAKELLRNWPSELLEVVDSTPDENVIRNPLGDRWLWPVVSPPASAGRVVLVGDAWHPMTPNLGQGACCALEDSVVLAKKLGGAINSEDQSVEEAFKSYGSERWSHVFSLTVRAWLAGAMAQTQNPVLCYVRNNILIPKLANLKSLTQHTNYPVEKL